MSRTPHIKAAKKTYALVVDGECEFWYFQMLKRHEKNLAINIRPEIPQKKKLADQYDLVKSNARIYDTVFWVIDFDVLRKEKAEAKKGKNDPIAQLRQYCDTLSKKHKNVVVIINNPCFEFWILAHYELTNKFFADYKSLESQLQKHLPDYAKTRQFYTKEGKDIYLRLHPNLPDAIHHATQLGDFDFETPDTGMTEMERFFNAINNLTQK